MFRAPERLAQCLQALAGVDRQLTVGQNTEGLLRPPPVRPGQRHYLRRSGPGRLLASLVDHASVREAVAPGGRGNLLESAAVVVERLAGCPALTRSILVEAGAA